MHRWVVLGPLGKDQKTGVKQCIHWEGLWHLVLAAQQFWQVRFEELGGDGRYRFVLLGLTGKVRAVRVRPWLVSEV